MPPNLLQPLLHPSPSHRQRQAWLLLRLVLAGLIGIHGVARVWYGAVAPFGQWLEGQGWTQGLAIAVLITALEICGPLPLALGRCLVPLCLGFAALYAMGIALVHAQAGWFVVGLGRNGAEYSVLLIVCLLLLAWQSVPPRSSFSSSSTSDSNPC